MARFIAIMSGKGGVGKTTTSVNLGLAMHHTGKDVVLLDGNLSSPNLSLHLGKSFFPITIHDVMSDIHPISNAVYEHYTGLKIIPADISVSAMKLVNFDLLEKHLQDLHLVSDYVVIDGSPGLGRESTSLIDISDELLIVTNQDVASVHDAKRVIDFAKKRGKTVLGILVNKYKKRYYKLTLEDIEDITKTVVLGTIQEDKRFEKSHHKKTPYLHIYPKRKPSKTYKELAEMITGRVL